MRVLVFGAHGWIGGYIIPQLKHRGIEVIEAPRSVRADDISNVTSLLHSTQPSHVLCLIGRTHGEGHATIDYLEQSGKLPINLRDNLFAPVALALLCQQHGIHFTYMGTGCIFSCEDPRKCSYTEEDTPDFFGSSYSIVKGFTDRLFHLMPHTLNLRIRMPITSDKSSRNFITKITSYKKICSIPNSMSVLPTLIPAVIDMMLKKKTGTVNLVNPGVISHNEVLDMYKQTVDPSFTWENFTIEEQDRLLLAKRSNNQLSTTKLTSWYPDIPHIKDAVQACMNDIATPHLQRFRQSDILIHGC